jgi:hypothetical protein
MQVGLDPQDFRSVLSYWCNHVVPDLYCGEPFERFTAGRWETRHPFWVYCSEPPEDGLWYVAMADGAESSVEDEEHVKRLAHQGGIYADQGDRLARTYRVCAIAQGWAFTCITIARLLRGIGPEPAMPPEDPTCKAYVTLEHMAAAVSRTKRTLEKRKTRKRDPLPPPAVDGGGGYPDQWLWADVRPWLEREFGKVIPERFSGPSLRGRPS